MNAGDDGPSGGRTSAGPSGRTREAGFRLSVRALSLADELEKRLRGSCWEAVLSGVPDAPDPELFFLNLSKLCDALPPEDLDAAYARPGAARVLGALLGGSEVLPERMAARPEIFRRVFVDGGHDARPSAESLVAEAHEAADASRSDGEIQAALRGMKNREMARIGAQDLAGLATLDDTTEDLSALAAATLAGALRYARRRLDERFGVPRVESPDGPGRPCGFVVIAMGKFGAEELNVSSDIDLLYLYETDKGMTDGGTGGPPVTLHQYFVRLSETITRLIAEATPDGFVFRVDLRLRPEGTKGDLANSLRSAEIYYESWGQTWERAALIKARPVAGDLWVGEEFLRTVAPFVYRKYLDFTAIDEIKEMKDRIDRASARSHRTGRDLKLGVGGIREIEFFVQAQQLIYGGKTPELRERKTRRTLSILARLGIIPEEERRILDEACVFLRRLEHRVQIFQERQTHVLPSREIDRARLARAMGLPGEEALLSALDRHAGGVHSVYGRLFSGAKTGARAGAAPEVLALLDHDPDDADLGARLRAMGFSDVDGAKRNLGTLRDGPPHVRMPARARGYLRRIAPALLTGICAAPDPDKALAHVERFLAAIGARTMFYALLNENPKIIEALVRLFGSSAFLSGFLLRHPELLDTFLRYDLSVLVKSKSGFRKELGEALVACEDLEEEMDELRRYKNLETLRIGIHEMAKSLSLEEGMFQLSALAETLLFYALFMARREVTRRFGVPVETDGERAGREAEFCILGMGKLGGEELSYHGDLDIIFVYSGSGETQAPPAGLGGGESEARRVTNHEYFAKVAQRLISVLTTATKEGTVYRLDTRLRPSGNAGPLVSSLSSFERYHEKEAQLWERQALLKCRFVAGDREFGKRVEKMVERFIYDRPLPAAAAEEIHRLRKRMELELGKESEKRRNVKVGRGGVVDVEFATQYLQLRHGGDHPSVRARGTLKALHELFRAGVLAREDHDALSGGYLFLRSIEVALRLERDASTEQIDPSELAPELLARYRTETERIRAVYLKVLGLPGDD